MRLQALLGDQAQVWPLEVCRRGCFCFPMRMAIGGNQIHRLQEELMAAWERVPLILQCSELSGNYGTPLETGRLKGL